ncbi:hypothetical protein SAMN02745146_2276 [Hymenobacter daecheongensis DSM 21074]|uniref:PQQ-like domain-containing protein n=1 Tax=Hymenobacter daecheongensis DSM 21074 TaxID=1121955 RepID=A0A1M6GIR3_9BACT|nr:hypothetical protein [Hymenobacter daecheongensis]SHJ09808.1 hypothetical protein SAMN02745146_2276 [Hymenobacter daecheongensis DSM 21074]
MISSERNKVLVDGSVFYQTRYHITQLLELAEMYLLVEVSPLGILYNDNVTAISPAGELLWKAQVLPSVSGAVDNPYMSVRETEGQLWASNWLGWAVQLDPANGHILQKVWTK